MGSCFSDEISKKLKQTGHSVLSNPFGTIFHPSVIANSISSSITDDYEFSIFERKGRFYSWETSTLISDDSEEKLKTKLTEISKDLKAKLSQAKLLIITLGTAWGYELSENGNIVANCHKMPSQLFTKFLSSPHEVTQDLLLAIDHIQKLNPEVKVILTVSPVRHIKDGIIENNLSKARLIEAVHRICCEDNVFYFPSYELVIDVLRDYRFYKEDRVHPNEEAIQYVWDNFENELFDNNTKNINEKVYKVNQFGLHISTDKRTHEANLKAKIKSLTEEHPSICWYHPLDLPK